MQTVKDCPKYMTDECSGCVSCEVVDGFQCPIHDVVKLTIPKELEK